MQIPTKRPIPILGLCLVFLIPTSLMGCLSPTQQNAGRGVQREPVTPTPLISRNVPAYTNDDCQGAYPSSLANDNSYDTKWLSCTQPSVGRPVWLAYDTSRVPASERSKVLVVWYNETFNYDHTIINDNAYDIPGSYTIDVNPAPGGGNPPTSEWTTLVTVKNNHYHSRQAIFDMTGNNWLRINVTVSEGSPQNYGVSLNMDVYDASKVTDDDFIFFGGSNTAGTMAHYTVAGTKSFAQLINAQLPDHFPVQENGGIGYLTSADGAKYINTWLPFFPGHYVGLSYGTNDALGCVSPTDFYNNYVSMVRAIIKAGKVPIISHITWSTNQNVQSCAPTLNAKLDKLYIAFSRVVKGPDFWAIFLNHPELLSDGIHPNDRGAALYRKAWAHTIIVSIYKGNSAASIPTPMPSS